MIKFGDEPTAIRSDSADREEWEGNSLPHKSDTSGEMDQVLKRAHTNTGPPFEINIPNTAITTEETQYTIFTLQKKISPA